MSCARQWANEAHDYHFLFADTNAHSFYRKSGFQCAPEYRPCIPVRGRREIDGARLLHPDDERDRQVIYDYAARRTPVSDLLGVMNSKLFMFWCLSDAIECIYQIPALDIVILIGRADGIVSVFDIVGRNIPTFDSIYPYIARESDRTVEFSFMTDKLGLHQQEYIRFETNGTHILSGFPLAGSPFIFPFTAHA
jgi:hypothetical protein